MSFEDIGELGYMNYRDLSIRMNRTTYQRRLEDGETEGGMDYRRDGSERPTALGHCLLRTVPQRCGVSATANWALGRTLSCE